jgi:hypothetical protein
MRWTGTRFRPRLQAPNCVIPVALGLPSGPALASIVGYEVFLCLGGPTLRGRACTLRGGA